MTKPEKMISLWARIIWLMDKKSPKEKEKIIERLAAFLKKKKKTYLLAKIFQKAEQFSQKEKEVELIISRELTPRLLTKIKEKLINILGKDKEIKIKIDPELIAGFRIKTANLLIKASLKDFLEELKKEIL